MTKHLQAVSTRNARSRPASLSSGDGEYYMLAYKAECTKETELRELRGHSQEDGQ